MEQVQTDFGKLEERIKTLFLLMDEREKQFNLQTKANETALTLAREQIDHRLTGMNEFQKRMDRLENTFATKLELKAVEKIIYIGIGIVLALQALVRLIAL